MRNSFSTERARQHLPFPPLQVAKYQVWSGPAVDITLAISFRASGKDFFSQQIGLSGVGFFAFHSRFRDGFVMVNSEGS